MKIRYLLQGIGATLGLSTLLVVSYPITANAESDLRTILEDASGQVWVGDQPYDQQLHQEMIIPFDTTIKIEGESSVVFTYYWTATINNPDDRLYGLDGTLINLDGTLSVNCAKTVFMRNKGTILGMPTQK